MIDVIQAIHDELESLNAEWFEIDDNEKRVRMQNALGLAAGPLLAIDEGEETA